MYRAITHDNLILEDLHPWQLALKLCVNYEWDLLIHYNRIHDLIKSTTETLEYRRDSIFDIHVVYFPDVFKSTSTKPKEELNYHAYQDVGVSYVKKNYGSSIFGDTSPQFINYKNRFQYMGEYQPQFVTTPADRVGYHPPFTTTPADRVGYHVPKDKTTIQGWVNYINCMMKMDNSNRVRFLSHIDINFFRNDNPNDEG